MFNRAAEFLIENLKELGFKVMRYDAYTSKSIYLKLDDGVIGTIRISDHKGKKHLRYKYNLIKGSKKYKRNHEGVERYFFPMSGIELLIEKLTYDRQILFNKYGKKQYELYMKMNRERGKSQKGFWQSAYYV